MVGICKWGAMRQGGPHEMDCDKMKQLFFFSLCQTRGDVKQIPGERAESWEENKGLGG